MEIPQIAILIETFYDLKSTGHCQTFQPIKISHTSKPKEKKLLMINTREIILRLLASDSNFRAYFSCLFSTKLSHFIYSQKHDAIVHC